MENLTPEDINQIHLYIHKLMDDETRQATENRIKADPEFAAEVEVQRIAQIYQFTKTKDHLKSLLDEMLAEGDLGEEKEVKPLRDLPKAKTSGSDVQENAPQARVVSLWPRRIAVAAVVIVALGIGVWFWMKPATTGNEIAEEDKKDHKTETPAPVDASVDEMVNGLLSEARQPRENIPAALQKAVGAFENEKDDEAIRILNGIGATRPADPEPGKYGAGKDGTEEKPDPVLESYRKFYLGVSYLSKGDAAKALVYLRQVRSPLEEDGRWYTALAYLKNGEPAKAKPILTTISNNSSSRYAGEAAILLEELK